MNRFQELWWAQAKSDHDAFQLLFKHGSAQCHLLHFLQMATEKIAKAYLWRSGVAPPRHHAGFVQFLRFLGQVRRPADQGRISGLFEFGRFADFQRWIRESLPIAYDLERLAPSLAQNGPNPEYPWPHDDPQYAPARHNFTQWAQLTSGRGRRLVKRVQIAVEYFPQYADL